MANRLPGGTVDYGCRHDSQVTLDRDGYYTFVIGAEAQRAAIERTRGVTFLPFSAADRPHAYKLNLRNMLADPAFAAAIQHVPADGRSASAAAVMGSYYPRAAFCSLATLATSGPTACLGAMQPPSGVASGTSMPGALMGTYGAVILLSWAAFLVVWGVGALNIKRDMSGAGDGVRSRWYRALSRYWLLRLGIAVLVVILAARVAIRVAIGSGRSLTFLSQRAFAPPAMLGWIAAALVVLGVAIAIWARVYLGRNWSSHPAMKEEHTLVTTGPYAYVRHPIYTGVMLAGLGSALTGSIFGIGLFILIGIVFGSRMGKEERIMHALFPDAYPAYQARTKRLVPFVW